MRVTAWRKLCLLGVVASWILVALAEPLRAQEHWLSLQGEKVGQATLYRRVREFHLIRSIGILLPKAPEQVGIEYLEYSDDELNELEEMTEAFLTRLQKQYRSVLPQAREYFGGRALPDRLPVEAVVTNMARSGRWAQISVDGTVRVDAELFHRNLRATLDETIANVAAKSYEEAKAEESELLEYFPTPEAFVVPAALKLRRNIELADAPGFLASRLTVWGFVSTPSISQAYESLLSMERKYVGTLLFVLAHELGHHALGTIELPPDATPVERREAELDADRFASLLLANVYLAMSIRVIDHSDFGESLFDERRIDYNVSSERLEKYTGDGIYFTRAYHSPAGYTADDYPTIEERLAAAKHVRDTLYEDGIEAVFRNVQNRTWFSSFVHNLRYTLGIP